MSYGPSEKMGLVLTGLKYLFAFLVTIRAGSIMRDSSYVMFGFLELLIIFCLTNLISRKNVICGWVVNSILLLLYNAQMVLAIFGSSYLTLVMVTNLDSVEDLSGNTVMYVLGVIAVILFSILPVRAVKIPYINSHSILTAALAVELAASFVLGSVYSPIYDYFQVYADQRANQKRLAELAKMPNITGDFAKQSISPVRGRPENLPENPNVVVIFTEGLSRHIVHDERNIMPNVKKYEEKSLSFTNYYNHTFATYRGLIGQIYSGYQLNNYDENSLISMADIFRSKGYQSAFINVEPKNRQFTDYLRTFGFDEVIGDMDKKYTGKARSMSDKEAYELLYKTMEDQSQKGKPFFTAIYTLGTHVSMDSVNEKFGDGKDPELNKFYDADYQFGQFMKKFEKSKLADNTLIVFTTDHASYADSYYNNSFPNVKRVHSEVDEIPLFFYYKGVQQEAIDVKGRNSLDMAPTVFDYVGISGPNYFLGYSLFHPRESNNYNTVFTDGNDIVLTDQGNLRIVGGDAKVEVQKYLDEYYAAKLQEPEMKIP